METICPLVQEFIQPQRDDKRQFVLLQDDYLSHDGIIACTEVVEIDTAPDRLA